jgi:hypothetical protein
MSQITRCDIPELLQDALANYQTTDQRLIDRLESAGIKLNEADYNDVKDYVSIVNVDPKEGHDEYISQSELDDNGYVITTLTERAQKFIKAELKRSLDCGNIRLFVHSPVSKQ